MNFDDLTSNQPTRLQSAGKYICIFSGTVLCLFVAALCRLWLMEPAEHEVQRAALSFVTILAIASLGIFLGGIALVFKQALLAAIFTILAVAVFVWGMPDR